MSQLLRLLRYLRPYWLYSLSSVLLLAMVGAMAALRVLLVKPIFDNVLTPNAPSTNALLFHLGHTGRVVNLHVLVPGRLHNAWTVVAFVLVVSAVLKSLCDYAGTYLVNYAGFGMITDLRNELYEAMLRRSVAFFQRHSTGTLVSTLINDVEKVQLAMSAVLAEFLQQLFTLLFLIGVVVLYGGKLAWVLLLFLPVILSSARRIGSRVRQTTRRGQDKLAEIQNILHESIAGNRIVKAFGMERWEMGRFRGAAHRLFRANLRSVSVAAISSPLMDALGAVAIALLLLLGRERILHGQMTTGSFIAFLVAVFTLYDPVRKFTTFYNSFQQAIGASEEIFRFVDEQQDVLEQRGAYVLPDFERDVVLDGVGFSYESEGERIPVLREIDLRVGRGEVVALVGPSGAGKSTLVNLLPRFFDATAGSVRVDGRDVREVTLDSLRKLVGTVTQETVLFNDTVRNNIAYGRPDVPLEKVEAAARAAMAHEFVSALPEGYETVIGERGTRLSGGERQRIAIARALLKNAPILILDEATSALDVESERAVQAALGNLMRGRTVVVIAHRLSTVRQATRIAVLERGEIVESGTHEELLQLGGTYARLYSLQFAAADDVAVADGAA